MHQLLFETLFCLGTVVCNSNKRAVRWTFTVKQKIIFQITARWPLHIEYSACQCSGLRCTKTDISGDTKGCICISDSLSPLYCDSVDHWEFHYCAYCSINGLCKRFSRFSHESNCICRLGSHTDCFAVETTSENGYCLSFIWCLNIYPQLWLRLHLSFQVKTFIQIFVDCTFQIYRIQMLFESGEKTSTLRKRFWVGMRQYLQYTLHVHVNRLTRSVRQLPVSKMVQCVCATTISPPVTSGIVIFPINGSKKGFF